MKLNGNYRTIPPSAGEIEEAILGATMIEDSCLPVVLNLIFPEVFYAASNQLVFKAIIQLYDKNQKIDILTVTDRLAANQELDLVGGAYYITKLTNSVVSSANVEEHCRIILEKYMAREMIRIANEAVGNAYKEGTDVFELYDKTDAELLKTQEATLGGMVKDMRHYTGNVYKEYDTVRATGVLGVQTGIIPLDRIFCGLVPPDLFIIAARPSQGKTALALSITHHTSVTNREACAWFSLEMNGTQLARRLAAINANLPHELIRQGKLSRDEEDRFFASLDIIKNAPIFIEDRQYVNIRNIRTRANILVKRNNIKYIVVDYLQLMTGTDTKNKNREVIISEISRGLKQLALELNIPVIALSQLNRKVEERADKMPQMADLRESGAIEQDADEILFLMRPEFYDFREDVEIGGKNYNVNGLCIGKGAKNRHGKCQNFAMHFDAPQMHFSTHMKDVDFQLNQNANYYWQPVGNDVI